MVPKIFIYSSDERLLSLKWVAALPIQSLEDVLNFQISEQSPVNCLLIRQIGSDLLKNAPITVPPRGVCATRLVLPWTFDTSLFKKISINEQWNLQFRAEAFNVFNHANFAVPNAVVFQGTNYSSSAGIITGTATTARQIQFALKLLW